MIDVKKSSCIVKAEQITRSPQIIFIHDDRKYACLIFCQPPVIRLEKSV